MTQKELDPRLTPRKAAKVYLTSTGARHSKPIEIIVSENGRKVVQQAEVLRKKLIAESEAQKGSNGNGNGSQK